MRPKEAFEAIQRAIAADPRKEIVHADYRDDVFGNFHIAFMDNRNPRSIVNDRFELVVCENLDGHECRTIFRSIRDLEEAAVLEALRL